MTAEPASPVPRREAGAEAEGATEASAGAPRAASSITLRGVHKTFPGDVTALEHVDLQIEPGEFFTLLGPSGCGKTTLLRIIAGLEQADAGVLEVGGRDILDTPPHRRSVNTVFQSYALFPHLTVRENIGFGLRMRGVDPAENRRRVDETAAFIRIGDLLARSVEQLSGGQAQRVALARALINEPDVLLLDEPLSALDAGLRSELQLELLRIQQRLGMTFVFVTHDQGEAMVMSDRIAVLNDGRIQQLDSPDRVYERPSNLFVARFMGHTNIFPVEPEGDGRYASPFGTLAIEAARSGSHVLVRPESLDLVAADVRGANHFPARIQERFYRGATVEYRLVCGREGVTVSLTNRGQTHWRAGDEVTLVVDPQSLVFLDP